ncbi:MAG: CDP-diacylglycerol--serine O-phosphatidyltransferase [Candidatus Azobacteroides pseudotrichonymphae]|jgi:CDP-diacylglycerol--serine O-phosphatidyltransferase|uniref:Phosphatidylserine synthase n=1 Tax=Azobacteroides pseudotrichonymphae genomovar. CFP2 TaxID=511995 RepID=B6YRT3_AZOPC|nr:CDP-alcohol phosphatidyltransferase family protein [Candidatus Azobacteroides pseudotrichonymphae]BAG83905.1 phosphatidylserine synthase [Candidatus Azobacteroides pseudotrichonymphae genomovar. CFP2]GMO33147.1 MAG: CDP-diacylglycerol--serine O-phosphatidyltransferase [Candidatus Azobacteroides pseudotrichonymphae]
MNYIPNIITCLNLLFGCIASVMSLDFADQKKAFFFILLACICDYLDGLSAFLLKIQSKLGAELDSLADIVSFGIAPSCIVYTFLKSINNSVITPYCAFLLAIFAALRLAHFNIDTQQTISFLGLPVPASALFWAGLIPSCHIFSFNYYYSTTITILTLLLVFIFCFLMVSSLPMISLKFKKPLKWKNNVYSFYLIFIFIALYILFLVFSMPFLGISLIIVFYIILSIINSITKF